MAARNSPPSDLKQKLETLLQQVEKVLGSLEKQVNELVKELESGSSVTIPKPMSKKRRR